MRGALSALLAELLELELPLDLFDVLFGVVIRILANTALEANDIILTHDMSCYLIRL